MRRDLDLIVQILVLADASPEAWCQAPKTMPGYESREAAKIVSYHIDLCEQAGYIKRNEQLPSLIQMTWAGHEALKAYTKP